MCPAPLKASPRTAAATRSLFEDEIVRSKVDKDKLRFLSELLQSQEKAEAQAEAAASKSLPAVVAERDTLLAKVAELQPIADKVSELETFKASVDDWKAEQVRALTADAQAQRFAGERARNEARSTLASAMRSFDASGLEVLMSSMRDLVAANNIPQIDIWNLPKNFNPLLLTLWPGWTRIKAQVFVGLTNSYKEPTAGFREAFLRCLSTSLPVIYGVPPDPIENRDVKLAVMTMLAEHWGIMADITREFEQLQVERQADFLRNQYVVMHEAETSAAMRGEGRTEINVQPQESVTGYQGECIDPEHCCCPKHNGLPAHLREDVWLGTRSAAKEEDINTRHEVNTLLDYGKKLIEREALAKKGKIVTVDPPESVTLDGHHSLDDEDAL